MRRLQELPTLLLHTSPTHFQNTLSNSGSEKRRHTYPTVPGCDDIWGLSSGGEEEIEVQSQEWPAPGEHVLQFVADSGLGYTRAHLRSQGHH